MILITLFCNLGIFKFSLIDDFILEYNLLAKKQRQELINHSKAFWELFLFKVLWSQPPEPESKALNHSTTKSNM